MLVGTKFFDFGSICRNIKLVSAKNNYLKVHERILL